MSRKRSLSVKELSGLKKPEDKTCPLEDTVPATPHNSATHEDMERVISRLGVLQASIDHLLGLCLQDEPEESSVMAEDEFNQS